MYTALDSKDLDSEFRSAYASRPSRSDRKQLELSLEQERTQFQIEQEAKRKGNVEVPFRGIEEAERRIRSEDEMMEEAKWLESFFAEANRPQEKQGGEVESRKES